MNSKLNGKVRKARKQYPEPIELTVTHTVNGIEVSEKELYEKYVICHPTIDRLIAFANSRANTKKVQ